ncbi:hypothetical protein F0562_012300 [Nyssa sinensis]|uniref:BZIP domain-containing protein n=1 Tax=Nyssa sinensis TaxID=561372 RepID=A0A5J4ZX57_9ASTE|nr:hypothetical protein F0562_012300 [Nyssa sinensis]
MTTDDWVSTALTDDTVVVELLFRLKKSLDSYSSLPLKLLPLLGWGHRQQRSKPAMRKEQDRTRCSPTTPLSWSGGGASASDGYDESSRPSDCSYLARSKGTFTNETTTTTTNKRSRKKKTFAELKEEESLLLKEKLHLKKEIATLHVTLKEQRARNENLKRIKLDLHLQSANKTGAVSDEPEDSISSQPNLMEASTLEHVPMLPTHATYDDLPAAETCKVQEDAETRESCFIIPDLNMAPFEEDSGSETLYGMS